jgi:hypothetical protein
MARALAIPSLRPGVDATLRGDRRGLVLPSSSAGLLVLVLTAHSHRKLFKKILLNKCSGVLLLIIFVIFAIPWVLTCGTAAVLISTTGQ